MIIDSSAQAWVRWWCEPWQGAHSSWRSGFAEHTGLALTVCEQLAQHRPEPFMRFVGMMMPQPPAPDANTLQWLALESGRRQLAMSIVEQICAPDRSSPSIVDEHAMWCRSLAMALRPGLWLQNLEPDRQVGVCLLAHWIGPDCWSRLRLAWPMPLAEVPEQDITVNAGAPRKLQALWPAVLWRVTVSTQDTPEVSNVG